MTKFRFAFIYSSIFFIILTLLTNCRKTDKGNTPIVTTVPFPPTDLTATVVSTTQVNLSWVDKSSNEVGFKLERKTPTTSFATITNLGADITTHSDNGLTPNSTYTYRVYSYNSVGSSPTYSNEVTVTTIGLPILTTTAVTNITATDGNSGGIITSDGGSSVTARGIVWSTSQNPTVALSTKTTDGSGTGTFTSTITGLSSTTKYYIKAYATNTAGTAYGNEVSFTTTNIDLKSGMIAYYPFTGNAGDSSGNNYHGIVNGATLTTDRFGNANKAYSFDGKTSRILIDNAFFDVGWNEYTISCWYNLNQMSNSNNGYFSHIFFNSSPHTGIALDINWGNSSKYSLFVGRPTITWTYLANAQSTQNAVISSWKHVTLVKSQNQFNLYIDGQLDKTWTSSIAVASYMCKIYLGGVDPTASNETFLGKLDDFRFYKRALIQDEITYLANH
jgi:hypothetical protein